VCPTVTGRWEWVWEGSGAPPLGSNVLKGVLIDKLRSLEYQIVREQLQARLHKRRLNGARDGGRGRSRGGDVSVHRPPLAFVHFPRLP